jgi:hypothetical protein
MLIGITGKAGSGKDTTFERIVEMSNRMGLPSARRIAFADKLKLSAAALLNLSVEDINSHKSSAGGGQLTILGKPMSMREFLQRYGTEAHRQVFGDNFWVDAALPYGFDHSGSITVVTDVRFQNEADRVWLCGGIIVEVVGPNDEISKAAAGHASEAGIGNPDFTIDNTRRDTFGELDRQIRGLLTAMVDKDPGQIGETGEPNQLRVIN